MARSFLYGGHPGGITCRADGAKTLMFESDACCKTSGVNSESTPFIRTPFDATPFVTPPAKPIRIISKFVRAGSFYFAGTSRS